ncbi:MAG: GGDEF domain-containing protein [Lachnospiraceae bacterium]|nr:GGDEF domain-containing protein [Lachnospiraceae bacterium]
MLEGNYFAITSLVSALVCTAILICNNMTSDHDDRNRKYFSVLLVMFIAYCMLESFWGLISTKTIVVGTGVCWMVLFLINLLVLFAVTFWCIFLTSYFGYRESVMFTLAQCIPLVLGLALLCTQTFGNSVFRIDDNGTYIPGPYRSWLFAIQFFYFAAAFIKIVYFVIRNRHGRSLRFKMAVLGCALVPVVFVILRYYDISYPYYSVSMMVSAVIVFDGMMIIVKIRNAERFETVSKDTYMGFEALSRSYVSVVLIDLETGRDIPVKSTTFANDLMEPNMPIREKILKVLSQSVEPEYLDDMMDFADIELLDEKMKDENMVSIQYRSKGLGWCTLSFIAAERDATHMLKKVILAIQSIDTRKKKELEYEEALSRAYRDENAVLGELIKMQSTGVVASRERKIIIANDVALEMFNHQGMDPIGMEVFDFWKNTPIKTSEDVKKRFLEVEKNGGSFDYQTVSYTEGNEEDMRYLMAEVKRVDLLDGTTAMITCFTDITQGKLLEDRLRTLSETDALTGIANRRCGESQIKLLMNEGIGGIFCLFDVDEFKKINDTFGHQTGDDTLVAVAGAIKASFRSDDIFMRLGGDEFAIYMRGVGTRDLAKIRIARLFENIARIELPNIPKGSVTISLGAALVETKNGTISDNYDEIYRRADAQMYKCKGRPGSNLSIEEPEERPEERTEDEES